VSVESIGTSRNELAVLWDVVVAPRSAFDAIAQRPRWASAFLVTALLGMLAAYLQIPAAEHVTRATMAQQIAHNPQLAAMPSEKQAQILANVLVWTRIEWLAIPVFVLLAALITALLMTVAKAAAGGQATFAGLFALAMNVGLIYWGVGYLFIAALITVRGSENFSSAADMIAMWPGLAWLTHDAAPKTVAFLAGINVFSIWSAVLLTLGLERIARIPRLAAAVPAVVAILAAEIPVILSIQ
jgi:hypothetical protein